MPAGTPRGFNLANMPGMMNGFSSGFSAPNGFPGFPTFGNHNVQVPSGWAGTGGSNMGDGDGMHQPGPMRRGGGRFQASRAGPYDRRQPRYANNGRVSPSHGNAGGMMVGARMGGGGGKWGDGAGAQTVGPREAVQGRSLKSYEDLDAVGGGGGGELNY